MSFTRRDALKTLGALAGTATASRFLSGCGGLEGAGQISTMVFMMMENRSYNHYLGSRSLLEGKPGDGLLASMANPDMNGNSIGIFAAGSDDMSQCVIDPPHDWDPSRVQFDGGLNDGFVKAFQQEYAGNVGTVPMGYMTRAEIPVLHALADAYTTCDRWFSSLLGPTLPNRLYWHAASSNGAISNTDVIEAAASLTSIYQRLNDANIDWAYYYGDAPVVGLFQGLDTTGHLRRFLPDFLDDAQNGVLPPIVYIDPSFTANDDHPPHHPLLGEQLISAAYTALATSPQWSQCMMVIAYDEAGGFFDHVPPGTAPDALASMGFNQLGFRIPGFVIGPYAKQGYVSSVVRDHTSPLKHIENAFGLAPLSMRDAAANDLSECLDLDRLAAGKASDPITLPAVDIDESMLPAACSGVQRRLEHLAPRRARHHPLARRQLGPPRQPRSPEVHPRRHLRDRRLPRQVRPRAHPSRTLRRGDAKMGP